MHVVHWLLQVVHLILGSLHLIPSSHQEVKDDFEIKRPHHVHWTIFRILSHPILISLGLHLCADVTLCYVENPYPDMGSWTNGIIGMSPCSWFTKTKNVRKIRGQRLGSAMAHSAHHDYWTVQMKSNLAPLAVLGKLPTFFNLYISPVSAYLQESYPWLAFSEKDNPCEVHSVWVNNTMIHSLQATFCLVAEWRNQRTRTWLYFYGQNSSGVSQCSDILSHNHHPMTNSSSRLTTP